MYNKKNNNNNNTFTTISLFIYCLFVCKFAIILLQHIIKMKSLK